MNFRSQKETVLKLLLGLVFCLLFNGELLAQPNVRIGILSDGDYWKNTLTIKAVKEELNILADGQYTVSYPANMQLNGNYQVGKIKRLAKMMADSKNLDLIISVGHESAKQLINIRPLKTPVVATAIEFPIALGMLHADTMQPINPNWTTSYDPAMITSLFFTSKKIINFKHFTLITSEFLLSNNHSQSVKNSALNKDKTQGAAKVKDQGAQVRALPNLRSPAIYDIPPNKKIKFSNLNKDWVETTGGWIQKKMVKIISQKTIKAEKNNKSVIPINQLLQKAAKNADLEMDIISISADNIEEQLKNLKTNFLVVGSLNGLNDQQQRKVFKMLAENKIPNISTEGSYMVKRGALMSTVSNNFQKTGRTYAIKINSILSGIAPKDISVIDDSKINLAFNLNTAKKINFEIPIKYYYEAELFDYEDKEQKKLTLAELIEKALNRNQQIEIDKSRVKQSQSTVDISESGYLPQLSTDVTYSKMDNTRADLSPSPRSQTVLKLKLSQKIWDPELSDNIELAKQGKAINYTNAKLNKRELIKTIASTYFDVLRNREILESRKDHLMTYRHLLDIAKLRYNLKVTGKTDVLRVQTNYEKALIEMSNAIQNYVTSTQKMNRLLNLPQETELFLDDTGYSRKDFRDKHHKQMNRFKTVKDLEILGEFFIKLAYNSSEEVQLARQQLEQASLEKERIASSFLPKASASASWFKQLSDDRRDFTSREEAGGAKDKYEDANSTGWAAQVSLSLPIFTGGSRLRELERVNEKIIEKTANLSKAKAQIAENTKVTQSRLFNNRRKLANTTKMQKSARESFELGQISYREGSITMLDLLDLQNSLITSEINTISTRFQFFQSVNDLLTLIGQQELITQVDDSPKHSAFFERMRKEVNQKLDSK